MSQKKKFCHRRVKVEKCYTFYSHLQKCYEIKCEKRCSFSTFKLRFLRKNRNRNNLKWQEKQKSKNSSIHYHQLLSPHRSSQGHFGTSHSIVSENSFQSDSEPVLQAHTSVTALLIPSFVWLIGVSALLFELNHSKGYRMESAPTGRILRLTQF